MHLYRIITDVRAGAAHQTCRPGQPGLATVWVQSNSEEEALRRARQVIDSRNYQSTGELTLYMEESITGSGDDRTGAGDPIADGYSKMRDKALRNDDGLFEIWFTPGEDAGS